MSSGLPAMCNVASFEELSIMPQSHLPATPCRLQGCTTHMLTSTAAADQSEPSLILVVHGGAKRLPDGRPLLHVSCVDQDAAKRAIPTEASRQAPFARQGGW